MGAIPEGNESFIPGFIAHNVLESATETLGRLWETSPTPNSQEIMEAWSPYMQEVFADVREKDQGNKRVTLSNTFHKLVCAYKV